MYTPSNDDMAVRPGRLATPNLRNWSQLKGRWERIMIGVTLKDRKSTEWIRKQSGLTDIIRSIRESKHRWAGHVARRRDNRWTIRITEWIPAMEIKDLEADQEQDGATI